MTMFTNGIKYGTKNVSNRQKPSETFVTGIGQRDVPSLSNTISTQRQTPLPPTLVRIKQQKTPINEQPRTKHRALRSIRLDGL